MIEKSNLCNKKLFGKGLNIMLYYYENYEFILHFTIKYIVN